MSISMYQATVPPLLRAVGNLSSILEKASAHGESRGIDPQVLLQSRLYPDMFPLVRQVQIASDLTRRGTARLAGVDAPPLADTETSFPELIHRLQTTIAYLESFKPEQIDGTEDKEFTVPVGGGHSITMRGWPFLSYFLLPNVFFHVTTAYAILRHNGVELGKRDFLGQP
ncbi:MAG: DUF1993 domain-containing protein [Nodosilinea sp. LVE1205-7]